MPYLQRQRGSTPRPATNFRRCQVNLSGLLGGLLGGGSAGGGAGKGNSQATSAISPNSSLGIDNKTLLWIVGIGVGGIILALILWTALRK